MVSSVTLKTIVSFLGIFVVACVFITCRYMFGTYSLYEASEIYSTLLALDKKYKAMFVKRENYRYHIGSAESRGTF
jgi:hypothetical protein